MRKAGTGDQNLVLDILTRSFEANKSVNYIIRQDARKRRRIRALMDYSFEVCRLYGEVFVSDDRLACALLLYPEQKRTTLRSAWLDLRLIVRCIGLGHLSRALGREALIRKVQPQEKMSYLWFISVDPEARHQGIGSALLQEIIRHSGRQGRPLYLETSTAENLPWYKKYGFDIYAEEDLGYTLYFLRRSTGAPLPR